ncbi:SMR family transporter [Labrys sp. LIt4]|uniref:DMT family transporter n=1 Tax=Labrys sp. LIt4 TaxID=2821355 RepID=UPI002474C123|nr:SMR family transporter [Labrys sp. LIt4]
MSSAVMTYAALVIAVILEIIATSLLKASDQFTRLWPTVMMGLCYMAAFYFLSYTLRTMPVGIAYALWSGIGIVLISVIGFVVFNQSLDLPAIIGIGLILAGVVIINLMSKSISH